MSHCDELIESESLSYKIPQSRNNAALRLARFYIKAINKFNPTKAANICTKWFFTPRRSKPSKNDVATINKAQSRQTLLLESGVQFESFCWGEGDQRILLVHGWESRSAHFRVLIDRLVESGFQVVSFDAPGHGLSPGDKSEIQEFIDILFLLEKNHGSFYAAIGHSLGGLALINAVKNKIDLQQVFIISAPTSFPAILRKYANVLALPENLHQALRNNVKHHFSMDDSLWDKYTGYKGLENIQIPAMIFHDIDDDEVHSVESECLSEAWPNATLIHTKGLGHRQTIKSNDITDTIISTLTEQSRNKLWPANSASEDQDVRPSSSQLVRPVS